MASVSCILIKHPSLLKICISLCWLFLFGQASIRHSNFFDLFHTFAHVKIHMNLFGHVCSVHHNFPPSMFMQPKKQPSMCKAWLRSRVKKSHHKSNNKLWQPNYKTHTLVMRIWITPLICIISSDINPSLNPWH